jgi:hypothetical protein
MRLTTIHGRAALAGMTVALAACSDGNAGAGASFPPVQPGTSGGAVYHLVTQVRPESLEKYFARLRALHKMCATAAGDLHVAVKPFPRVPEDFVAARNIYASDGKRIVSKEIKWTTDDSKFSPETGCEMRLTTLWKSAVVQNGKERAVDFNDEQGLVVHEEQPHDPQALTQARLDMYSKPKSVNGVQLKCSSDDICIVDPALALIKDGRSPVHAAERIRDGGANGSVLLLEPVSLTVGAPVDPQLFKQENGK